MIFWQKSGGAMAPRPPYIGVPVRSLTTPNLYWMRLFPLCICNVKVDETRNSCRQILKTVQLGTIIFLLNVESSGLARLHTASVMLTEEGMSLLEPS